MATVLALPWPYLCWNLFNRIHLKSIVNCRAVTLPAAAVVVLKGERGVGGDGEAGLRAAVVHDHEAVLGGRQVERLLEGRARILNEQLSIFGRLQTTVFLVKFTERAGKSGTRFC